MKKMLSVILTSIFILNFTLVSTVNGENDKKDYTKAPYIKAHCAVGVDAKSKRILFQKDSDKIVPMASTTKILTALVALSYGNLDKKVEISKRAAGVRGSTVGYKKGEEISIRELVYGLMLRSGNDAAIAIAEGISGNVDSFLELMNEYALQIGLVDSHFESPHGLDSSNHYTTAYELALLTAKAKELKEFNKIVSQKDVNSQESGFTRSYHNINKILWQLEGANGVKTGYTGQAGKCLVTSVPVLGNDIIIVVLNSPTRWEETCKVFDYVKNLYEYKKVVEKDEIIGEFLLNNKNSIILKSDEDIILPVKKGSKIDKKVLIFENLSGNLKVDDEFGTIQFSEDDEIIFNKPLKVEKFMESGNKSKVWLKKFF
jgi:D-alanyl-D-alanine carboxypeptidase (penicillin-binding protein 5/6)